MVNKRAVLRDFERQKAKKIRNISALARKYKCSRAYIYKVIKTL